MKPTEEREVTLTSQRPYRTVKGTVKGIVRDGKGEPVSGALVPVTCARRPRGERELQAAD